MTIQVEILQFLHYNPSSSRVEISAGLTEAPNERTLKRIIAELVQNGDYGTPVPNYTDENVSTKVVKIIQSYTGIVNKMVWRK